MRLVTAMLILRWGRSTVGPLERSSHAAAAAAAAAAEQQQQQQQAHADISISILAASDAVVHFLKVS